MPERAKRLPPPALVISLIALVFAVGSGTFAIAAFSHHDKTVVKRIADREIRNKAPSLSVSHASSADTATGASQLDGHAAGDFLLAHSRGVALAGAKVAANGTVESWFNTLGGAPTAELSGGAFYITFPGVTETNRDILQGTQTEDGQILVADSNGGTQVAVQTYDSAGTVEPQTFYVVIYGASPTG